MSTQIDPLLTVDDLDAMPDDGNRYEIIEGVLFVSRSPGVTHQMVSMSLAAGFAAYLTGNPVGRILATPGVILSHTNAVIPDLVFISSGRWTDIVIGDKIIGAPDLIIEIVSPGNENEKRDRVVKRQLYGNHGVKEYWLVYPEQRTVEIYHLEEESLRLHATLSNADELTSTLLPGLRLRVESIFEN